MPGSRKFKGAENLDIVTNSVTNPEERQLEYLERREKLLRKTLKNRPATKDKSEPELSPTQENLNDEDEPSKSTNERSSN